MSPPPVSGPVHLYLSKSVTVQCAGLLISGKSTHCWKVILILCQILMLSLNSQLENKCIPALTVQMLTSPFKLTRTLYLSIWLVSVSNIAIWIETSPVYLQPICSLCHAESGQVGFGQLSGFHFSRILVW